MTGAADQQPSPDQEALSLKDFAKSLYHAERADNYFKFLNSVPEKNLPSFFQNLLSIVGDAIDDRDTTALARFVQEQQAQAYIANQGGAIRPNLPAIPPAPLQKPLHEAKIALFTSGAIYMDDQEGFYPAHLSYEQAIRDARSALERVASLRMIPADTAVERLKVGHIAYDIRAAQKDINVIFPLERFRELAQEGTIGALAERSYSYHGLTNIQRLRDETAPQWARMLQEDGVDAVFLTPG